MTLPLSSSNARVASAFAVSSLRAIAAMVGRLVALRSWRFPGRHRQRMRTEALAAPERVCAPVRSDLHRVGIDQPSLSTLAELAVWKNLALGWIP